MSDHFTTLQSKGLNLEEVWFLALVRLKCAFSIEDLVIHLDISGSTVSRILFTWLHVLQQMHLDGLPKYSDNLPTVFSKIIAKHIIIHRNTTLMAKEVCKSCELQTQ